MENIHRIHNILGSSNRFKNLRKNCSVSLSSSKAGSSSCQCSTTLYGEKENAEKCKSDSPEVANSALKFPRGHWSFLGPGCTELLISLMEFGTKLQRT